ncbi:TadE/TadG family type IV pilus assembly protein [Magnetospirillum moscoviense]|uniref:TadE-like domain-containing protein n=1 Tax=Magnetospirillum moscoviense TaxID=1437059 RepID=A0A178MXV9_9PROT|nr:TadE/TadG family type IV pilus assembly protein [Magnetospirillum moscoviense]MBF0325440.1 pilus assembly protein [Alphaproteobacteria bacterium]OAN55729.1 hypothetical protein A6A05_08220 [Magnetospirillum moscoviense]
MIRRLIRDQTGASAVEFALVAPMLIALVLGLVDFGQAMRERMQLTAAAHAGIQYAALNPNNLGGISGAVTASGSIPSARLSITTSTACECSDGTSVACAGGACPVGSPRTYVTVTVAESYPLLFHYPGLGTSVSLSAQASQRVE